LAGTMSVYAISEVLMIFRDTDFLKYDTTINKTLSQNIPSDQLSSTLQMKINWLNLKRVDTTN
jgi:hypothetical protein